MLLKITNQENKRVKSTGAKVIYNSTCSQNIITSLNSTKQYKAGKLKGAEWKKL